MNQQCAWLYVHSSCGTVLKGTPSHVTRLDCMQTQSMLTVLAMNYLSEAREKGSVHGCWKLACGGFPCKEDPVPQALCHDVIVLRAL